MENPMENNRYAVLMNLSDDGTLSPKKEDDSQEGQQVQSQPDHAHGKPPSAGNHGNRGRGERRGGGRGGRGGRGGPQGGQNGTRNFTYQEKFVIKDGHVLCQKCYSESCKPGTKTTMKREDGGARNHGNVKKDFDGTKTAQKREKGEARNPGNVSADIEKEAQPQQMTLEEYREQEKKNKTEHVFNVRQAGEGCRDESQYKKPDRVLKKKVDDFKEEKKEEEKHYRPKKQTVNIEINFKDEARSGNQGRGGRFRGRGMDRGGRGRNVQWGPRGGHGGQRQTQAFNVDNVVDFPSLGN